jgi:hypothetical protein
VLSTLQVEKLLLPAVAEVVDTWKRSFGFAPVEPRLREEAKRLSMVVVTGTTLLQKPIVLATTAVRPPSSSLKQQQQQQKKKKKAARGEEAAPPMTEDELAFLEMIWPVCSFTDLVAGIAYSPRPFCADPLSAAVRGPVCGDSPGRGGRRSCAGEAAITSGGGYSANVFQMPSYPAAARGGSLRLGINK